MRFRLVASDSKVYWQSTFTRIQGDEWKKTEITIYKTVRLQTGVKVQILL